MGVCQSLASTQSPGAGPSVWSRSPVAVVFFSNEVGNYLRSWAYLLGAGGAVVGDLGAATIIMRVLQ